MAALSSAADYKGVLNKILDVVKVDPAAWVRAANISVEHKDQVLSEYNTYRMAKPNRIHQTHTQEAVE